MSIPYKSIRVKLGEFRLSIGELKDIDISIGYIVEEWEEPPDLPHFRQ